MGISDRDYMRARRKNAARLGSASWIDAKGRVQHHELWIDPRRGGSRTISLQQRLALLASLLSIVLMAIPLYQSLKREGWVPDAGPSVPFPQSGSVTVSAAFKGHPVTSSLTIISSAANAVVQFVDPDSGAHLLSIYAVRESEVTVPIPSGTFRVRLVEGQKWHGPDRYFGPTTAYETVAAPMTFEPRSRHWISLERRPDGNLPTRQMMTSPVSLAPARGR